MGRTVQAKKKCCDSSPRCKKCPIALKKLAKAGYLTSAGKSGKGGMTYALVEKPPKAAVKAARKN